MGTIPYFLDFQFANCTIYSIAFRFLQVLWEACLRPFWAYFSLLNKKPFLPIWSKNVSHGAISGTWPLSWMCFLVWVEKRDIEYWSRPCFVPFGQIGQILSSAVFRHFCAEQNTYFHLIGFYLRQFLSLFSTKMIV